MNKSQFKKYVENLFKQNHKVYSSYANYADVNDVVSECLDYAWDFFQENNDREG